MNVNYNSMVGMGENIGSGFPTVMKAWKEKQWLTPEISERVDLQIVTLSLKLNAGATDTPTVQATDQVTPQATPQGILQVADMPQVTDVDISQVTPQATPQASIQATDQATDQASDQGSDQGNMQVADISQVTCISTNQAVSQVSDQGSDQGALQCANNLQVEDVFQSSKNNSINASFAEKEIMAQVLFYCSEPRTLKEIMEHLHYTHRTHFVNTFITPLLGKFLKQTHPKYPKHPNQKYVVIKRKKNGGAE